MRFTVQLYNPDQQVVVHFKPKTWNSPPSWSFEMPQYSFREPSSSTLDRVQIDPAAADTTPKLRFSWRKDSKLSKDLTCFLRGKTTAVPETKTKNKEPDITLSIFKSLREMTLYEPNLYRVEMEDFKGLELVLMMGAITIRDVYFASPKEAFRISRQNSASASPASNSPVATTPAANRKPSGTVPVITETPAAPRPQPARSPPATQQQDPLRKEEDRRTKKMLEEEEKARQKRQVEVDKETRRLQKLYGEEEREARTQTPSLPPRPPAQQGPSYPPRPHPRYNQRPPAPPHGGSRPYLQVPGQMSTTTLLTPPGAGPQPSAKPQLQNKRSSFFGLRRTSDDGKLSKKRSSMF